MRASTRIAHGIIIILLLAATATAQRPEIVPQAGHASNITAFAFSTDGKVCATGDNRGIVKVWETRGGRLLRTIQAHAWLVNEVALSADGRSLASAGQISGEKQAPNTVKLWNVAGGKMLLELEAAPFAFSPGGKVFAAGVGTEIKLWDAHDGRLLRALAGHALPVASLSYSPDGKLIGSHGGAGEDPAALAFDDAGNVAEPPKKSEEAPPADDRAKIWDAESGKLSAELEGCHDVRFSPDGTLVADEAGNVCETKTGKLLHRRDHGEFVTFSPDGTAIVLWENVNKTPWLTKPGAAPRAPARLVIVEARGGGLLHRFDVYEHYSFYDERTLAYAAASSAAYSPDGRMLVVSGEKKAGQRRRNFFAAWDARAWRPLYERDGYRFGAFSTDGKYIDASRPEGEENSVTELLETNSGKTVARLSARRNFETEVHFSPDGGTMALVEGITLSFRDADGGRPRSVSRSDDVAAVVFSPDGKRFAVSKGVYDTGNQRYELWETGSGGLTYSFNADAPRPAADAGDEADRATERAYDLDVIGFSPDGGLLATGDARVRDVQSGSVVRKFAGGVAPGTRVHAVLTGGAVELRDARSNRLLRRIPTPNAARVALSPDERLVAVGFWADAEVTVRLYDAVSGRLLHDLEDVTPWVVYLAFSPDSRLLAVSTTAGSGGFTANSIFDARTGRLLTDFFSHNTEEDDEEAASNKASLLAVSADGKYALLQGDQVAGVELRDAATGKLVKELPQVAPHGAVCADFSPDGKLVVTGDFDTGVRFWSIETGELLATVISFEGGDWLALTPDGLFDGSPAAWGRMLWRFSEDIFDVAPAELFFNEFYYPGLLADVLAGRRPRAAADIARKDRRQPRVAVELAEARSPHDGASARTVKLRLRVEEEAASGPHASGSGARDVRLFRNGSLVRVWNGDVLGGGGGSVVLETDGVPLVAGENRFMAYAFNHDNVKSADAVLTVRGDEALRRKGTVHVLAVGVNAYANPQYDLRYAVADARAFGEQISREQERLGRYARVEVTPLYDGEATKANILRALGELAAKVQPEDAVVFFFAGHGTAHESRFYLLPHDLGYAGARGSLDRAGLEAMLAHGVSDRELEEVFRKVDAGQILFVIDACNSGQALEAEEKRRGPMNSKGLAQLAYEKGMYVLTAAQSYQAAQEVSQLGHGLLTYALVEEGLKQGAGDRAPRDGSIFAREWLDYATARVPEIQIAEMKRARARGINLSFADEERALDLPSRSGQRPRVFYRRESEAQPLVIAALTPGGQTREPPNARATPRKVRPRRKR